MQNKKKLTGITKKAWHPAIEAENTKRKKRRCGGDGL
jgi:hypothetical protein